MRGVLDVQRVIALGSLGQTFVVLGTSWSRQKVGLGLSRMESRIASDCSSQKPSDTAIVCKGFCHHYGYGPLLLVHLKSLILTLVLLQHRVRGIMNKEAWLASAKSLRLLP